jgi:LuxR family transcriptional regulator, maltose regulon positive regulatory protein
MTTPVLTTKLFIPPAPAAVVSRARLLERLSAGLHRRLTLICAPAGFGKTTLASEWLAECAAQQSDVRTAWLSLDEGESEPARFLDYLIAALETAAPGVGRGARPLLASPQPPPAEAVVTALLNEIATLPHRLVLVLDDYHVVEEPAIDEALAFMLEHLPPRMHVVMLTREDPGLPVARLRARGHVTEVRAADLRFTPAEAADFLTRVMGLDLSEQDVAALEARTEGWIAGLQMAALALQATAREAAAGRGAPQGTAESAAFIQAFTGSHRFVMDYLMDEVLRRQTDDLRDFLLRTSILERSCGPLCDALTGRNDGARTLECLERGNLFVIPLDGERRWYRYHHLFADVLRTRLLAEMPGEAPALHGRASVWYEHEGLRADAIRHAFLAGDLERAADLVELAGLMVEDTAATRVWRKWVAALPDELVRSRPVLSGWLASALLSTGEFEAAEARLADAERWLRAPDEGKMVVADEEWFRILPATIAIVRAYIAQARGDVALAIEHAEKVLQLAPEGERLRRMQATGLLGLAYWSRGDLQATDRAFTAVVTGLLSMGNLADAISAASILPEIRMAMGRLGEAERTLQELLDLAMKSTVELPPEAADLFRALGGLALERGDLETAAGHLSKSRELSERGELEISRYRTCMAEARLSRTRGDFETALALLDEAERHFISSPLPEVRSVGAVRAEIWAAQGRVADARRWVNDRGLSSVDELSYLREFEHLTLARILVAQHTEDTRMRADEPTGGPLRAALDLLERLLAAAEEGGRIGSAIEILATQALAHEEQGDASAALASLAQALSLAAAEDQIRPFLDGGPAMAQVLREAVLRGVAPERASRLLAVFPTAPVEAGSASRPSAADDELLSRREVEILRHIAAGLTNQEIASRLYLSLYTVKAHARTIYDKLDAHNRTLAVAKARELGILPPV